MSYPLSDTFATAPVSGYTTVLGSMSATHNSVQQAIDVSAPSSQSILRFNETAHGDFWFEADVEFLTDPSARKHIGLWMTTGNGSEGYRFAHLDSAWVVTRWNNGFGDGAAVTGSVNAGAKPVAGVADAAPTFNVGQRLTLRCELLSSARGLRCGRRWVRRVVLSCNAQLAWCPDQAILVHCGTKSALGARPLDGSHCRYVGSRLQCFK
ncbi:MAG: hypothetical protein ACK58C_08360 [Betaproteobacteria bacterium]